MRGSVLIGLALMVAGCAPVGSAEPSTASYGPGDWSGCGVKVDFGSYAMGIDNEALGRMRLVIDTEWPGTRIVEHRWGREGEVSWCVVPKRQSDAAAIAARLKVLIPEKPRGPITVELILKR